MKPILVFPRDANPYQRLLDQALAGHGIATRYLPWRTRSHTLNLLLLPAHLLIARARGHRVVHLHWVYPFALPPVPLLAAATARRLSARWFALTLGLLSAVGLRLVWTAHNVTPHRQVFDDDVRERRRLVATAHAVVVHSPATAVDLAGIGARPRDVVVAPHGPYFGAYPDAAGRAAAREALGVPADARLVLFFGRVERYKGVVRLLRAWPQVRRAHPSARLLIAGDCADQALAAELRALAAGEPGSVCLRLGHVPDRDLPALFAAANLVCLPFERVTTSGSALLAAGFAAPLLVPDLPALRDLPEAVLRYPAGGLARALTKALGRAGDDLDALGRAARDGLRARSWDGSASAHAELYRKLAAAKGSRFGHLERGSAHLLLNHAAASLLGFAGWMVVSRAFAPAEVGVAGAAISTANLVASVALLGTTTTILRFLPTARSPRDLLHTCAAVTLPVAAVLGVAAGIARPASGPAWTGVFAAFTVCLVAKSIVESAVLAGRGSATVATATTAGNAAKIGAAAAAGLLLTGPLAILALQLCAPLVGIAVLARRLRRQRLLARPFSPRLAVVRTIAGYASATYLNGLIGALPALALPPLVLHRFGAAPAAGWYLAMLLAGVLFLLPAAIGQALMVEGSHEDGARDGRLASLVRRACVLTAALVLPAVGAALLLAPFLLRMFGADYPEAATSALRLLILSTPLVAVNYVAGTVLAVRRRLLPLIVTNAANAGLVLALAGTWAADLTGVGWAWLAGEVVNAALFVSFAVRAGKVRR